ncbi:MAG: NAD-dependent epimerase/dehydratase family protein [Nanoarchaeota archaeon]|nr:NAD-dependent epimerase/dehydratase family protein [Nanoarchaeota archaeon]
MKILVTGGAGFIASNLVDELVSLGHSVIVIDNLSTGKTENLNKEAIFYRLDISDKNVETIFKKHRPDIVDHHAAQISVVNSVSDPIKDAQTNIIGLLNILTHSVKYKVKKVINVSSGGVVYGDPKQLPAKETLPFDPLSPYGISKTTGEYYLRFFSKVYGLKSTSLRYSNVYGPRQDPKGEAGVIAIFSKLMLRGKAPTIFGNGRQERDYVFVKDIVDANVLAMTKGDGEAFNIGTGIPTSVNQLFSVLKTLTDFDGEPIYGEARKGELFRNYLDSAKAKRVLGWKPKHDLENGLKKTLGWVRSVND